LPVDFELVMKRVHAFTLVELLVVISIVALLLAILMPALTKARIQAQRVICLSNTHEQCLIQFTYTADFAGKFPNHTDYLPFYMHCTVSAAANGVVENTRAAYEKYVSNSSILICAFLKTIGYRDPWNYGFFTDTRWYTNHYKYDKGGWDAKVPGTKNYPHYILNTYNWYASWKPCMPGQPEGYPIDYQPYPQFSMESKIPSNVSQCGSKTPFISHCISALGGSDAFTVDSGDDFTHGGTISGIRGSLKNLKGTDTPMCYGDGHSEYTLKSKMRKRIMFYSAWGGPYYLIY
jgi:prepilin-type N-terminal cleavage/methylation domain-containing protein